MSEEKSVAYGQWVSLRYRIYDSLAEPIEPEARSLVYLHGVQRDLFPKIEQAIEAASREIDAYCGRRFWQDGTATARTYYADTPRIACVDDIATTTGLVVAAGPSALGGQGRQPGGK